MLHFLKKVLHYCTISLIFSALCALSNEDNIEETDKELTTSVSVHNSDFDDDDPVVRIKDIISIKGVRANHLVGWGLVVGLNGTGDSLSNSPQTKESLVSMFERLGVNIRDGTMSSKNVAMVMVTATLPPFAREGSRIDITVSAVGDAKSLSGGTLLVTALKGADGQVYSVAQGQISVSGIAASGANAQQTKGVPTTGKIANGALVEKEVGFEMGDLKKIDILLSNPDISTAKRIAQSINTYSKSKKWSKNAIAVVSDMGTINIQIPKGLSKINFFDEIGQLKIKPDQRARVIIDENNGVIAMTSKTKISPIALTHGSITIKVVEEPRVYMPNAPMYNVNTYGGYVGATGMQKQNTQQQQTEIVAQKISGIRKIQEENLKLLQKKQELEITDFNATNNASDPLYASNLALKKSTHEQEIIELNNKYEREISELQNQVVLSSVNPQIQNMMSTTPSSGAGLNATMGPGAQTVTTSDTKINVKEEKGKFSLLSSGVSIDKFVNALNQLGVSVKDMGSILTAIKNAGALHADIEFN
ncbi:MAG: hypothetical protein C0432_03800 [Candidatus Puniceispirillum sp.]|nr:hypothetical protein [Candidatus Pelagibacter sp.]MBA4283399.1 hypothetical protein [Candidatus Puniceispirillum sp.]